MIACLTRRGCPAECTAGGIECGAWWQVECAVSQRRAVIQVRALHDELQGIAHEHGMVLQRECRRTIHVGDAYHDAACGARTMHVRNTELHGVITGLFKRRCPLKVAALRIEERTGR